ncbi:hypothetical protein FACS1894109_10170 [Spirochaetia bacterium]|nr:hypothetical protein FACS1894109_10170 [Spirochaetia bacterium]
MSDGYDDYDVLYKGRYVWDRRKNEVNKKKHRISFEIAVDVFDDPFYYEVYDKRNSVNEDRYNVTGEVTGLVNGKFITVSVTYRNGLIRIFSARKADAMMVRSYYEVVESNFR